MNLYDWPKLKESKLEFEMLATPVLVEFKDTEVQLVVIANSGDKAFHEAALAHCAPGTTAGVQFAMLIPLTEIIDPVFEDHQLDVDGKVMDAAAKPKFDKIRSDLAAMIARIDAVQYEKAAQ